MEMNYKSLQTKVTKLFSTILAVLLIISLFNPVVRAADSSTTYKITNIAQFKEIMNNLVNSYSSSYTLITLESDIKLSGVNNYTYEAKLPSGTVFDGKGHTISGINTDSVNGLFAQNSGTIKNLTVADSSFNISEYEVWAGTIVAVNFGTISNCHAKGINIVSKTDNSVGGIAGESKNGSIRNCTFSGSITTAGIAGGICGDSDSDIENCANMGTITCTNSSYDVGGICGRSAAIRNCYSVGKVTAVKDEFSYIGSLGAIVGEVTTGSTVSYIYSNGEINVGQGNVTNSYPGLTDSYMKSDEFVKTLNNNVGDNQEWLRWSHTANSYPVPSQSACAINVSKSIITTRYSNKNISLGFTTTGIKASDVTITSSKPGVASINANGSAAIKGPGVTIIKLSFKGNDRFKAAATKTITLKVKPQKVKGVKLTAGKKRIKVSWKKTKCNGYIIQYSTDKKFKKNVKSAYVKKSSITQKTIKKLKRKKVYYVRVIAYSKNGSERLDGSASAVKRIKVK